MKKIFFDEDGTLSVWEQGTHIDVVSAPGYMRDRRPMKTMIEASRLLQEEFGYECWIASAVLPYPHSIPDKDYWGDIFVPWIPRERRLYIPYGTNKAEALKAVAGEGDVFIDDYTPNLRDVGELPYVTGVKCLNGINDTHHTWTGPRVSAFSDGWTIARTITGLAEIAAWQLSRKEAHDER